VDGLTCLLQKKKTRRGDSARFFLPPAKAIDPARQAMTNGQGNIS